MIDVKSMVNAIKELNQAWDGCCADLEKDNYPAEVCNAVCEIDKTLIALTEKIGNCARACVIAAINGRTQTLK